MMAAVQLQHLPKMAFGFALLPVRSALPHPAPQSLFAGIAKGGIQVCLRSERLLLNQFHFGLFGVCPGDLAFLHIVDSNACHLERSAIKMHIDHKPMGAESKDPGNIQDIFTASGCSLQAVSCERPDAAWTQHAVSGSFDFAPVMHSMQHSSTRCAQDDRCVLYSTI
jgi:hypothetical protein